MPTIRQQATAPRHRATRTGAPRVSIIVVSYNTRELTLACLASVFAETIATPFEVIVVDNASDDGSAAAIRASGLPVTLIAREDNLGFARANNLAAAQARGELLLLLNPDTVVLDRAVDRLTAFADSRPSAGIWGGRTVYPDGRLNPSSCWRRMTPWNAFCRASGLAGLLPASPIFNSEAYGGWARDRIRAVDIVSGCFLLIRTDLWQRLGGFDLAFFMYGEEADLCLRARRSGARPAITPAAVVVHYGGASERVRGQKMAKLLAAKSLLIERHWSAASRAAGQALLALWPLSRAIALTIASTLTGRATQRESAATWWRLWTGRADWQQAYASHRPASPSIAAASQVSMPR